MGLMKVSGVIGIILLVLSVIILGVVMINSSGDNSSLKSVRDILILTYFILSVPFYIGFYSLGNRVHNNKLKIFSIVLVVFFLIFTILQGFSIISVFISDNAESNFSFNLDSIEAFSSSIFLLNLFIISIMIFLICSAFFYLSLIDIYFESNVKFSRVAGTLGIVYCALFGMVMFAIMVNLILSFIESFASGFLGTSSSDNSTVFYVLYGLILYGIYFATTILLSLALFDSNKKFSPNNGSTFVSPPTQTMVSLNPKSDPIISSIPPAIQQTNFDIPKIVEREK